MASRYLFSIGWPLLTLATSARNLCQVSRSAQTALVNGIVPEQQHSKLVRQRQPCIVTDSTMVCPSSVSQGWLHKHEANRRGLRHLFQITRGNKRPFCESINSVHGPCHEHIIESLVQILMTSFASSLGLAMASGCVRPRCLLTESMPRKVTKYILQTKAVPYNI